MYQRQLESVRV
ncbi:hypothetical protein Ocin01_00837 [Orchesella cincta]|uniref:Uncharacterized protein n=1 Tax=Orchesella cincta TaxID=48709 RepID=A0A1D2NKQ1_ORCCI|nr:hypothetical protein Ocin01_00837 [Orchesella cincta]